MCVIIKKLQYFDATSNPKQKSLGCYGYRVCEGEFCSRASVLRTFWCNVTFLVMSKCYLKALPEYMEEYALLLKQTYCFELLQGRRVQALT